MLTQHLSNRLSFVFNRERFIAAVLAGGVEI